jgi:hypothetical protein
MNEEKEDPLKGLDLPIPKQAVLKPVRRTANKITAPVADVVKECVNAIQNYNLVTLVQKAQHIGFSQLEVIEKELFSAGIIKLGEALTFCRDQENPYLDNIITNARICAQARNHFVHHQLYLTYLDDDHAKYDDAEKCIKNLPLMEELQKQLFSLHGSGIKQDLWKPIGKGGNDFPFKYDHYVVCLRIEFRELKQILSAPDVLKDISSKVEVRTKLENRIRNILAIMIDLTDKDSINKNNGDPCVVQKDAAEKIKRLFVEEFDDFEELFLNLKEFRNSLCHLDESLKKPYFNTEDMLAFATKLQKMEGLGYVNRLENKFLPEQKKESHKRDVEGLKSDTPEKKQSEKVETTKKMKAESKEEIPKEQKKEEVSQGVPKVLQYLSGYGSEEEEEQQSPSSAPGMRGGKK